MDEGVVRHYARGGLLVAIEQALQRLGKTPETLDLADLGAVDEFHIGGRETTAEFLASLQLKPGTRCSMSDAGSAGPAASPRWSTAAA